MYLFNRDELEKMVKGKSVSFNIYGKNICTRQRLTLYTFSQNSLQASINSKVMSYLPFNIENSYSIPKILLKTKILSNILNSIIF